MPALLIDFTVANDAAAGTTKKLQKQAVLGAYFKGIEEDDDLRRAVRYAAGLPFAGTSERNLNVGGRIVTDVLLSLLPVSPQELHARSVKAGEIGEALADLWPAPADGAGEATLTLAEVDEAFEDVAATGNQARKRELLTALFARCHRPREAVYLAKIIFGDLRTGVQEGVLQAAVAQAFERPLAEIHRASLLVGDLDEVAVLARHDRLGEARFRLFHPLQFMLATPQETPADAEKTLGGRAFYAEDKLDGIRAQVHKAGGRIAIYTRTMDRADEAFPDVVAAIARLPGDVLLDGEIVPWRDQCVMPFAHIQKRLGRKVLTPKVLRENPAAFIAFDLLYLDGELLMDRPLSERRAALNGLAKSMGVAYQTPFLTTDTLDVTSREQIEHAFAAARARRNEGIVLKDPASAYSPGRRGQNWLKLKTHLPTFDCVVTAAEYGHGKRRELMSDYTFAVWTADPNADPNATLVNVGKAFTGCTDAEIAELTGVFLGLSQSNNGRVHQVTPQVVLEIACDQIQKSARHASGYAFRFPRIKRIRYDKRPRDADTVQRVAEVYESSHNFGRVAERAEGAAEPTLFD